MNSNIHDIERVIRCAIQKIAPPLGAERPSTNEIYGALKKVRSLVSARFGGDVKCRYKGCPPVANGKAGGRPLKVLEYLWDFSFSRFDIPRAIEQYGTLPAGQQYELLFVAESELGSSHEVCRDLLKLLEARSRIKCLVYKQCRRSPKREELHSRMVRVLRNHAYFDATSEDWLFVGLTWRAGHLECSVYALNESSSALVEID